VLDVTAREGCEVRFSSIIAIVIIVVVVGWVSRSLVLLVRCVLHELV
jgi:hypothetical protein